MDTYLSCALHIHFIYIGIHLKLTLFFPSTEWEKEMQFASFSSSVSPVISDNFNPLIDARASPCVCAVFRFRLLPLLLWRLRTFMFHFDYPIIIITKIFRRHFDYFLFPSSSSSTLPPPISLLSPSLYPPRTPCWCLWLLFIWFVYLWCMQSTRAPQISRDIGLRELHKDVFQCYNYFQF